MVDDRSFSHVPAATSSTEDWLAPRRRARLSVNWRGEMPAEVLTSLSDRDRICPYPAGVCFAAGGQLVMRLPEGELALQVPARLMRRVFVLCDGTTSWNEVLGKVPLARREEMGRFLDFLWAHGALVDAIQLSRHAAAYAFLGAGLGLRADPALTQRIGQRFTGSDGRAMDTSEAKSPPGLHTVVGAPLSGYFQQRESVRTFDARPIKPRQLHALVWSAAGVVAERPGGVPRRTMGSGGGMHLVRWILVLPCAAAGYPAGVYEAEFPGPRKLRLRPLQGDVELFHRAFERPWQQSYASGALFAVAAAEVAALRYRNRGVQYLFLEAGAGMQNMALAAPALDLAFSVIGGYTERVVRQMCAIGDDLVLCGAIFGPTPTSAQVKAQSRMLEVDFAWAQDDPAVYPLPMHVGRAAVTLPDGAEVVSWGADADPRLAYIKAHAESVERQGMQEPRGLVAGRLGDLPGAIAPDMLAAYRAEQYRSAGFPFSRFDAAQPCLWTRGTDLVTGRRVHVPASFVFRWDCLEDFRDAGVRHTQANSSGCGAGPTREFALTAALLEVIERDAFMRCWLTQTAGRVIPTRLLPQETQRRVKHLQEAGCQVVLQQLPSVAGHMALVAVTQPQRRFTCVTGACRQNLAHAVHAALNELELMVYVRLTGLEVPRLKPSQVRVPGDHAALYSQAHYYQRAQGILQPGRPLSRLPSRREAPGLSGLVDALAAQGLRPAWVDITPQRHCIDQGRTPLTVVKAVVPSLVPISFGFGCEPRAMVAHVDSRSLFPHPFP